VTRDHLRSVLLTLFRAHRLTTEVIKRDRTLFASVVRLTCSCGWKSESVDAVRYEKELQFSFCEEHLLEVYMQEFSALISLEVSAPTTPFMQEIK